MVNTIHEREDLTKINGATLKGERSEVLVRKLVYISFRFASAAVGATLAASVAGGTPAIWKPIATTTPPTTATE